MKKVLIYSTRIISIFLLLMVFRAEVNAQYFGRNKARYSQFDFKVIESPHFEIYHYMSEPTALYLTDLSERWYTMHQYNFQDTIRFKNPIIFYNNHSDFQQTRAINSIIGNGTGGVTEGFKNRVVMPVMDTWQQTDHVLGHELVHAFQYNLMRNPGDSLSLKNMSNIPLWMVEGLAEYMSIGRKDPHTSMWMRDAVINDDIPSLKDLSRNPKYFPYRYGQAFWSFVSGIWGDSLSVDLFKNTARYGFEPAIKKTLNMSSETLSGLWKSALVNHYAPMMEDSPDRPVGLHLIDPEKGGKVNLAPEISPNGKYIIYLSEKDLFSVEYYLVNASNGNIIKKLAQATRRPQTDAVNFIESSGTWSPDSRRFAFVVFSKGRSKINIIDIGNNRVKELEFEEIPSITNPSWSPDGKQMVFTGLKNGQSDLFIWNFSTQRVDQLTDDRYSYIQPSWSSDGSKIVMGTDRWSFLERPGFPFSLDLGVLELKSGAFEKLPLFYRANHYNPLYTSNDEIVFISDRDGFRNIYKYRNGGEIEQLTSLFTGVSGITPFSRAMSISRDNDQLVYSHFYKAEYQLYAAKINEFNSENVSALDSNFDAAYLPPAQPVFEGRKVDAQLAAINVYPSTPVDSISEKAYKSKFKLDYIGNTGAGVAAGTYGLGLVGGVNALFSDMLGNNQLFGGLSVNGEVFDFGGQIAYFNRKNKIGWGVITSHIPYRIDRVGYGLEELNVGPDSTILVDNYVLETTRMFEERLGAYASLPLSQTRRFEAGGSLASYSFRRDRLHNYYLGGIWIGERREKNLEAPEGYKIWNANLAFVGDKSYFGIAAPMKGHRFRYDITAYGGEIGFYSLLADYRQYVYLKPITLGFRGYYYGRYGNGRNSNLLTPIFLGHPTLIRGYDDVFFGSNLGTSSPLEINDLYGNKMMVANFEIRFPLSGPERLAAIKSKMLFTDLNLFVDAGAVWDAPSFVNPGEGSTPANFLGKNVIVSTGASIRLNVFGQLVIEPYYAIPWQRNDLANRGKFGINFTPGW